MVNESNLSLMARLRRNRLWVASGGVAAVAAGVVGFWTIESGTGHAVARPEKIAADTTESDKAGRPGLDALLASRGVDVVTFRDWQKIDTAEIAAARDGAPREKFTSIDAMLAARSG